MCHVAQCNIRVRWRLVFTFECSWESENKSKHTLQHDSKHTAVHNAEWNNPQRKPYRTQPVCACACACSPYLGAQRVPGRCRRRRRLPGAPGVQRDECLPQEHLPLQAARVPHWGPQGAGRQQGALYLILGETSTINGGWEECSSSTHRPWYGLSHTKWTSIKL